MANIIELAQGAGCFNTLLTAVEIAGLTDVLRNSGPFTVFAPQDTAFEKLPPGTITSLVQNPPQLGRILTYHVVAGNWTKADLAGVPFLTSLEGSKLWLDTSQGLEVNNATVVAADIAADNGIVHVIDTVVLMGRG